MRASLIAVVAVALSQLGATGAGAATLEPVGTFEGPIFVSSDPADPDRLFVAERDGVVQLSEEGTTEAFADLSSLVSCCTSERGLLSVAVPDDFATTGRIYAAYTGTVAAGGAEGDIHVDGFRREGETLVREPIITIGHSAAANHNGGQLQFGPDGYLYLSTGDGGGSGDPFESGQDLATLLGKLLRIDPQPGESPPYAIPPGNPFAGPTAGLDEIWAYGLRNPWRFSFDRESGDLVIADVGQGAREEINFAPSAGTVGGAGANYGWDCREGFIPYTGPPDEPSPACAGAGAEGFTDPVFDYPHLDPEDGGMHGCSITGGYVVRDPSLIGDLYGRYVYGDFCRGEVRSIDLSAADPAATDCVEPALAVPESSLYSFGEDSSGRIYLATGVGTVYRVLAGEPSGCAGAPPEPEPETDPTLPSLPSPVPIIDGRPLPSVSLRARALRRRAGSARRVRITARVRPCAGHRGRLLVLRRGGKPFARKRLDKRCVARFRVRVRGRSTFRAALPASAAGPAARSRRLVLESGGRRLTGTR